MELNYYFFLASLIFSIGIYGILTRSNPIALLLSLELIFNAVNLNFVAASLIWEGVGLYAGKIFVLFIIGVVAAKAVIILAIIYLIFQNYGTFRIEELKKLRH